jgi:hypothetical protein
VQAGKKFHTYLYVQRLGLSQKYCELQTLLSCSVGDITSAGKSNFKLDSWLEYRDRTSLKGALACRPK